MMINSESVVGVWCVGITVVSACDHSSEVAVYLTNDHRVSRVAADAIIGCNQREIESTLSQEKVTRKEALVQYFSLRMPKIVISDEESISIEFLGPFPIRERIEGALGRGHKIIALIRHAERSQAETKTMQQNLHLTEWGRNSSRLLGEKLKGLPILSMYSSPIDRCVDTCKEMVQGFGTTIPIKTSTVLGDPGPFTADCDLAGPVFQKTPLVEIIKSLAKGDLVSGMRTIAEGAKMFLDFVFGTEDKVAIMLSHDAIITWVALFLLGKREVEEMMPEFLEALYLEVDEKNKLSVYYKEQMVEISHDELRRRLNERPCY